MGTLASARLSTSPACPPCGGGSRSCRAVPPTSVGDVAVGDVVVGDGGCRLIWLVEVLRESRGAVGSALEVEQGAEV